MVQRCIFCNDYYYGNRCPKGCAERVASRDTVDYDKIREIIKEEIQKALENKDA